jgi:hypothetical protein
MLGRFTTPGTTTALGLWLAENARVADLCITSIDMLAYGGLVASRTPAVPLDLALKRVRALAALRRVAPRAALYAFGIILRLGITSVSEDDLALTADLIAYAQLADRVNRLRQFDRQAEYLATERRIPAEVRKAYRDVRDRNHEVNRALVRLVADDGVDFAVLAQEDAAPVGLHMSEQLALRRRMRELGVEDRVVIHPGADEVAMTLLARWAHQQAGASIRVFPLYTTPDGPEIVALYEDRPLRETVAGHAAAIGMTVVDCEEEADLVVVVHTPVGAQVEIADADPSRPEAVAAAQRAATIVAEKLAAGIPVAVADVAYCNGADPALIEALGSHGAYARLTAYAGWNTAGNTLGTALPHACLRMLHPDHDEAHRRFLFQRLLDDYAYQTVVRQEVNAIVRRDPEMTPLFLGAHHGAVEEEVRRHLAPLAEGLAATHFPGWPLPQLDISLPWPRTFEVEIAGLEA